MKKSCILILKSEKVPNIILELLKKYAIKYKMDYNILELINLNECNNEIFENILIEKIENKIKNYKNVLIYYIGNGYYNRNNNCIFPLSKINNNIIDHNEIMEYFISYWNKKIIYICDCDNIENNKIKDDFYNEYLNSIEKCKIKVNIFNTINSPIIISSCPYENYSGLLTFNLFNNLNKKLENRLYDLNKNSKIIYDNYNKIPVSCLENAMINGFETTDDGKILKFNINNKHR